MRGCCGKHNRLGIPINCRSNLDHIGSRVLMASQGDKNVTLQTYTLSYYTKRWLQKELWKGCSSGGAPAEFDLTAYFKYYSRQCQRHAFDGGIHVSAKTHDHIVALADIVVQDIRKTAVLEEVKKSEPHSTATELCLINSVHLCAALLLMIEVGDRRFGFSGSCPLKWPPSQSLRQAVCRHFENAREMKIQPDNQQALHCPES
jgi:hypothetical protein